MPLSELHKAAVQVPENIERLQSCLKTVDELGLSFFQIIPGGHAFTVAAYEFGKVFGQPENVGKWSGLFEANYIPPQILCSFLSAFAFNSGAVFKVWLKNLVKIVELNKLGIDYHSLSDADKNQLGDFKLTEMSAAVKAMLQKFLWIGTFTFILFNILNDVSLIFTTMASNHHAVEIFLKWLFIAAISSTITLFTYKIEKYATGEAMDAMAIAQVFGMWTGFQSPKVLPVLNNTASKILLAPGDAALLALVPPVAKATYTDLVKPCMSKLISATSNIFCNPKSDETSPLIQNENNEEMPIEKIPSPSWQRGVKFLFEDIQYFLSSSNEPQMRLPSNTSTN